MRNCKGQACPSETVNSTSTRGSQVCVYLYVINVPSMVYFVQAGLSRGPGNTASGGSGVGSVTSKV